MSPGSKIANIYIKNGGEYKRNIGRRKRIGVERKSESWVKSNLGQQILKSEDRRFIISLRAKKKIVG